MPIKTRRAKIAHTEAQIQAALMNRLRANGWLVVRVNSFAAMVGRRFVRAYLVQGMGTHCAAGFPDVLALRGTRDSETGKIVTDARLFEVKKDDGNGCHAAKTSPSQKRFHEFAARSHVYVEVVTGWDEAQSVNVE